MKIVTMDADRNTDYAQNLVSRLFATAYFQHEKIHSKEEQMAKLNKVS
jgi:hypothetical protein